LRVLHVQIDRGHDIRTTFQSVTLTNAADWGNSVEMAAIIGSGNIRAANDAWFNNGMNE
jgi:hypothetical protein